MSEVSVRAPAKINLHLGVGAPRADGFHPLVTVYQAIGLHDDLTMRTAESWSVALDPAPYVDPADVPLDGSNIVNRAAADLADLHGVPLRGRASIAKAIPVAGGMAGGSADAAAALVAFDRLWDLQTSDEDLLRLAAGLGSDVPFALVGGTALGTGRGEIVQPVRDEGTWWWVVVPSDEGLSTPEVYRHFDRLNPLAPEAPPPAGWLLAALETGEPEALAAALHNDLQEAAIDLRPALGDLLERGMAEGAMRSMVSGSGPTCLFLCESGEGARAVAGGIKGAGESVVLVANGPVAGAHVVEYA